MRKYKNWNYMTFIPQSSTTIIKSDKNYILVSEFDNKNKKPTYFIKILSSIETESITLSYSGTSVKIVFKHIKFKTKLTNDIMYKYIFTIYSNFFKKVKVKGKGYRIRKKKKMLKFIMYISHTILVTVGSDHILKKIGKYKFMLISKKYEKLTSDIRNIVNQKYADLFTKRGMRIGRENIIKKRGKKSSYMK